MPPPAVTSENHKPPVKNKILIWLSICLLPVALSCRPQAGAASAALLLAYIARSSGRRLQTMLNGLVGMGYAVPGTVIAVGVLIPLITLDHFLVEGLERLFGFRTGLLLTGGFFVLIYAYLIRFLAVALQSVEAGLTKITPNMDDAARSLGSTSFEVMREVHMPLLRSSLITAGLLVFVEVMKELPATLVMRPFNFDLSSNISAQPAIPADIVRPAAPQMLGMPSQRGSGKSCTAGRTRVAVARAG